jgi:hypothetical protein
VGSSRNSKQLKSPELRSEQPFKNCFFPGGCGWKWVYRYTGIFIVISTSKKMINHETNRWIWGYLLCKQSDKMDTTHFTNQKNQIFRILNVKSRKYYNMFKKTFRHIPVVIYDSLATHQVNGPYQIVMKHIHAGWINSHVWLVESIWFWSIQLLVAFFKKYHGIICKIPAQFDQIKDHINRFPMLIRKLIFMYMFIPFVDSFPVFIPYVIKLISNFRLAWCISNFG